MVRWLDSTEHSGWHYAPLSASLREALLPITSVGFVLQDSEDSLLMAHTVGHQGSSFLGLLKIPKGAIVSVKEIFSESFAFGSNNTNGGN